MKMDEILELIKGLARSQGMYGRLYEQLMEIKENEPDTWESIKESWEAKNFKTALDFILFYEEGED